MEGSGCGDDDDDRDADEPDFWNKVDKEANERRRRLRCGVEGVIGEDDEEESPDSSGIISTVAMDTLDELAPAKDPSPFEEDRRLLTLNTFRRRLDKDSLVPMDISDRMETD